jgi:hypothetical protein
MYKQISILKNTVPPAACLAVVIMFIIAACKEKEDVIKQFMREPAPVITVEQAETGLKISWNAVKGAECYYVDRCKTDFGDLIFFYIYIVNNKTFYIDENPASGVNYYRVRAIKCKKQDECYSNGYSNVVPFTYTPSGN